MRTRTPKARMGYQHPFTPAHKCKFKIVDNTRSTITFRCDEANDPSQQGQYGFNSHFYYTTRLLFWR